MSQGLVSAGVLFSPECVPSQTVHLVAPAHSKNDKTC